MQSPRHPWRQDNVPRVLSVEAAPAPGAPGLSPPFTRPAPFCWVPRDCRSPLPATPVQACHQHHFLRLLLLRSPQGANQALSWGAQPWASKLIVTDLSPPPPLSRNCPKHFTCVTSLTHSLMQGHDIIPAYRRGDGRRELGKTGAKPKRNPAPTLVSGQAMMQVPLGRLVRAQAGSEPGGSSSVSGETSSECRLWEIKAQV